MKSKEFNFIKIIKKTSYIEICMKYLFLIFLLILTNCSSWNIAKKKGCLSPHANYYELETLHYAKKTRNYSTQSPLLLIKPLQSLLSKKLSYEDRCEHTKTLIMALDDPMTFKRFKWSNYKNSTQGEIMILLNKPSFRNFKGIGNELCRVYTSKIKIKKKEKTKKFRACNYKHTWGPHDRYGYIIQPHTILYQWRIFEDKYF